MSGDDWARGVEGVIAKMEQNAENADALAHVLPYAAGERDGMRWAIALLQRVRGDAPE